MAKKRLAEDLIRELADEGDPFARDLLAGFEGA